MSAQTFANRLPGLKVIPALANSPQFFNLAISKSNLRLASICSCNAICASAARLQRACRPPSKGIDKVADNPPFQL